MRFAICNKTHLLPLNAKMKTNGSGQASIRNQERRPTTPLLHIANLIISLLLQVLKASIHEICEDERSFTLGRVQRRCIRGRVSIHKDNFLSY